MNATQTTAAIDQDRRRLLGTAAMGIAAAGAASLLPSQLAAATAGDAIRPFRFNASDEELADLRRRVAATKWPDKETVADESQGVQLATMQKLARYWATDYDWRKVRGAAQRRCRTSSPRSTGSTSISSTSARSTRMRCR